MSSVVKISERGVSDQDESSLFETVVKIKRWCDWGRRSIRIDLSSEAEMELETGTDKVGGKPSPLNVVSRTLTTNVAILIESWNYKIREVNERLELQI